MGIVFVIFFSFNGFPLIHINSIMTIILDRIFIAFVSYESISQLKMLASLAVCEVPVGN
jgi:hypothetical protein